MSPLASFVLGLLVGWLFEWLIDWIYWRGRQLALRAKISRAIEKALAAEKKNADLERRLADLTSDLKRLEAQNADLVAEKIALQASLHASASARSAQDSSIQAEEQLPGTTDLPASRDETPVSPVPAALEPDTAPIWKPRAEAEEQPAVPTSAFLASLEPDTAPIRKLDAEPEASAVPDSAEGMAPGAVPEIPPAEAPDLAEPEPLAELRALNDGDEAVSTVNETPAAGEPPTSWPTPDGRDDLEKITGIGPVIAAKLRNAGVRTYRDLANLSPERLSEVLGQVIQRLANVDRILFEARALAQAKESGPSTPGGEGPA